MQIWRQQICIWALICLDSYCFTSLEVKFVKSFCHGKYYPHKTSIGFPIKRRRPHCSAGSVGQRLPGYCCYCGVHNIWHFESNLLPTRFWLPFSESFLLLTDNRTLSRHRASWDNQHRNYICDIVYLDTYCVLAHTMDQAIESPSIIPPKLHERLTWVDYIAITIAH